jgi:hypothetical protein
MLTYQTDHCGLTATFRRAHRQKRDRAVKPPPGLVDPEGSVAGWFDGCTCQPTRVTRRSSRSSFRRLASALFRPDDVVRLVVAAATPPPPNGRSAWPTRDVALVEAGSRQRAGRAHCGERRTRPPTGAGQGALRRQGRQAAQRADRRRRMLRRLARAAGGHASGGERWPMRRRHTDGMDLAMGGCTALLSSNRSSSRRPANDVDLHARSRRGPVRRPRRRRCALRH